MTAISTLVIKIALRSKQRPAKSTTKNSAGLLKLIELKFIKMKERRNKEYMAMRNANNHKTIFLFDMQRAKITYRLSNL